MKKKQKVIAIIPARSGSKGLKDKNIKLLNGKPLLAYSIEAALASELFDTVMVSTDSARYAEIAKAYGGEVPFLRSTEQSSDTASSWDVVREVLIAYEAMGKKFDICVLLQPTSPLRTKEDIIGGMRLMMQKEAQAVVGVCEMEHSPLWSNILPEDGAMNQFIKPELINRPRQQIETYYRINGALYIVKVDYIKKTTQLYNEGCYAYRMSKHHSIDIDDAYDFLVAEVLQRS